MPGDWRRTHVEAADGHEASCKTQKISYDCDFISLFALCSCNVKHRWLVIRVWQQSGQKKPQSCKAMNSNTDFFSYSSLSRWKHCKHKCQFNMNVISLFLHFSLNPGYSSHQPNHNKINNIIWDQTALPYGISIRNIFFEQNPSGVWAEYPFTNKEKKYSHWLFTSIANIPMTHLAGFSQNWIPSEQYVCGQFCIQNFKQSNSMPFCDIRNGVAAIATINWLASWQPPTPQRCWWQRKKKRSTPQ